MYTVVLCKELSFGDFCKLYVGTDDYCNALKAGDLSDTPIHMGDLCNESDARAFCKPNVGTADYCNAFNAGHL